MTYQDLRNNINEGFNSFFQYVGKNLAGLITDVGGMTNFGAYSIYAFFQRPLRIPELFEHLEFIGNKSLGIICMTGLFTGAALAFQIFMGFKAVNMTALTGGIVALGISRELGPVLTGLVISARAGGAMAARLGSMRVSEQIDALEVMGVEPRQFLVSPRLIASIIATPLLCAVFDFMSIIGAYFLVVNVFSEDPAMFWENTQKWMRPEYIFEGLFKSAVFGLFFGVICTFRGYHTEGGAEGVGSSTNRGVVLSMVMIIVLDFFLMNFINMFYKLTGLGSAV